MSNLSSPLPHPHHSTKFHRYECREPRCTETTLAYPYPKPYCPVHRVPMKLVKK